MIKPSHGSGKKESHKLPPGFRAEQTKNIDGVTASLAAIYADAPETSKDLTKLDHGRSRAWVGVAAGIMAFVAFLTSISWLGFWWWGGTSLRAKHSVQVVIEGPERISLGQQTSYFINWSNQSREALSSVDLRVSFPPDFVVATTEPKPVGEGGQAMLFRLGAQPTESRGTIKVTGAFTGELGTKSAIQVIATYRPTSSDNDFEELVTQQLEYADTVLEGALNLPPKVLPGDKITIAYTLTNRGSDALTDLEARLTLPEGFVLDPADKTHVVNSVARIPVGTLDAGASATSSVVGTFASGARGDIPVHAEVGRVSSGSTFAALLRTDGTLSVLGGDLGLKVVVNGSDVDHAVALGERLRFAISYENTSGEKLEDVTLRVNLAASGSVPLVDWSKLDDPSGGSRKDGTLTFTEDEIDVLEELAPEARGVLEFSVPLVASLKDATQDVPLLVTVEAIMTSVGGTKVNREITTQSLTLRLQTDATLSATAHYASEEGAPVGTGPLPPVAGSATAYRVEWRVQKTLHALDRLTVTATLPNGVAWGTAKEVGAGDVKYEPSRRLITWNIPSIPADQNEALLSFDVILTPSEADIGRFAPLLGESRVEFTDAILSLPLVRTASPLTTDLPNDELARGKGVVKKP